MLEAFVVAPRLIFVQKASSGNEPPVVHVYPSATERFRSVIVGIAHLQSWDGAFLRVPVLMSSSPIDLGAQVSPGETLPDATYPKLDELWNSEAKPLGLT